jgi:signal transduction histidine kinase
MHAGSAARQAGEARWRAVLAASQDGVLVVDAGGRIEEVNPALTELVRASAFALLGAPWEAILVASSPGLPSCGPLHTLSGRRADNTTFPAEGRFAGLAGAPGKVLCVLRDVSEKVLAERRLVEASEQLQRRLGADLHDGLGQLLTGAAFLAKGLEASVPAGQTAQAARVVELLNQAIARVRHLARGPGPLPGEEASLEAVLRGVVAESGERFGLECRFERRDPVVGVRPGAVAQLALIAREAITNGVRHGHAGRIVVSLAHPGARSLLSIEDDGIGIRSPLVEGLGLRSMRARADQLGGQLEVARAEVGTVVRCWWSD